MSFASSRNPYISNSFSGGAQCIGSDIKVTDTNSSIKRIYRATRQLGGGIKVYILHHAAIFFETIDGRYGIFEWMDDSLVHQYYLKNPRIYDVANKICQTLKELIQKVQECKNRMSRWYDLKKNNCQQFVTRILDQSYEKVTWKDGVILGTIFVASAVAVYYGFGLVKTVCGAIFSLFSRWFGRK